MSVAMGQPLSPLIIQRRLTELGRIRIGEKGARGEPKQRATFRLTSASERLLASAAAVYGGEVQPWKDAPDEGYFELATTVPELDILIPPTVASYSQALELWDRGGCVRRCDGVTESISGRPCMCRPDARECSITTRISVMLPKVAGLGTWRLDTKGWNAGATLPTTLATLGALAPGQWVPAVLRIEKRSAKRKVDGRPQTRRFIVPVIDIIHGSIGQALDEGLSIAPPPVSLIATESNNRRERVPRPELPSGPEPPRDVAPFRSHAAGAIPAPAGEPSGDSSPGGTDEPEGIPARGEDAAAVESSSPAMREQCESTSDPGMPPVERCRLLAGHEGVHRTKGMSWPR